MLEIIGDIGDAKAPEFTWELSSKFYYLIYWKFNKR